MPVKDSDVSVAAIRATMNRPECVRDANASARGRTHEWIARATMQTIDESKTRVNRRLERGFRSSPT